MALDRYADYIQHRSATMPIEWSQWGANSERAKREGRILEVRKHTDGTYRLIVWNAGASASVIAGRFSDPAVARHCAETMPLDDASLTKAASDPFGFIPTPFAEPQK